MTRKAETIKVSGGADYAKVAERTKLFWEENPRGSIITTYDKEAFMTDKTLIFETVITRDASKPTEGVSNGHALGKYTKDKDFEKYETISQGRALAKAGYLASGDIASFEEMEDYLKNKELAQAAYVQEQVDLFDNAKSIDELKELWATTNKVEPAIIAAKDKRKAELEAKNANN